jgi:hypothetical protein
VLGWAGARALWLQRSAGRRGFGVLGAGAPARGRLDARRAAGRALFCAPVGCQARSVRVDGAGIASRTCSNAHAQTLGRLNPPSLPLTPPHSHPQRPPTTPTHTPQSHARHRFKELGPAKDARPALARVASQLVSRIGRTESAGEIAEGDVPESPGMDKVQAAPDEHRKGESRPAPRLAAMSDAQSRETGGGRSGPSAGCRSRKAKGLGPRRAGGAGGRRRRGVGAIMIHSSARKRCVRAATPAAAMRDAATSSW